LKAQKPETIYSFAMVPKSIAYYKEQAQLWKKEIDKDKQNKLAWYYYYKATRNYLGKDTTDHRPWKVKLQSEKDIVDEMGKAIPNSFEYNLCKWAMSFNDYSQVEYLKKAYELGKDRREIITDMINWGELDRNLERRNEFASRWFESDEASPGLLNYNYNVLMGLKPSAILFTCGDNDTYPIWQLQSQGIRKDVTVLNLALLGIDGYRNKIFKELGLPKWDESMISTVDKKKDNPYFYPLIKHIVEHNIHYPIYVGLTVETDYTQPLEDSFYLTGMAYEYSNKTLDNIALLQYNFEHVYALDYLDHHFYKDISAYFANCCNQNYIVPMLKLYEHYKAMNDVQKQAWMKQKVLKVAKDCEQEKQVLAYFKEN
jgi:hypothetical protein